MAFALPAQVRIIWPRQLTSTHTGSASVLPRQSTGKFPFMPEPAKVCDVQVESVNVELTPDERGLLFQKSAIAHQTTFLCEPPPHHY
jgi:hypothetical protein